VSTGPAFVADATVELDDVGKWFGRKVAVAGISCSFGPGVAGLLGPNGAGKTTLLRMITGLIRPSQGRVRLLGVAPRREPGVYARVGLVPEEDAVYPDLTAFAYVRYAAVLSRTSDPGGAARRALAAVDLVAAAGRRLGGFSKGMRQRAKVAAALVADPQVLVLDEPLNGTDPRQRARLIALFRRLGEEGRTVIVSSHVLEEMERMAQRVVAVVDGKLAAAGDVAAIRAAMADIPYRVRVEADRPRVLAAALVGDALVEGVTLDGPVLHVATRDLGALGRRLPRMARDRRVRVTVFQPEDASLESVFRYLVHRR